MVSMLDVESRKGVPNPPSTRMEQDLEDRPVRFATNSPRRILLEADGGGPGQLHFHRRVQLRYASYG